MRALDVFIAPVLRADGEGGFLFCPHAMMGRAYRLEGVEQFVQVRWVVVSVYVALFLTLIVGTQVAGFPAAVAAAAGVTALYEVWAWRFTRRVPRARPGDARRFAAGTVSQWWRVVLLAGAFLLAAGSASLLVWDANHRLVWAMVTVVSVVAVTVIFRSYRQAS
jgi:hypothetical protein